MIEPFRRHSKGCPHRAKGGGWTKCNCKIYGYGEINGRRFRSSLKTRDWQIALKRIEALEAGTIQIEAPARHQLKDLVAEYLADCRTRGLADSSLRRRAPVFRDLLKDLGVKPIDGITTTDLAAWRDGRVRKPSTVRVETEYLRSLFAFACDRGYRVDNPAAKLRNPRDVTVGALPFTEEEVARLVAAAGNARNLRSDQNASSVPMCRALVRVLLSTGLRISDVAQLRRSAVVKGFLSLTTQKTEAPLKLKLDSGTIEALNALPIVGPYFFWSGIGSLKGRATALGETISAIGKSAGVSPCHPHRFRDTFASRLLLAGVDIRTVSKLLGHRSIRTTERHYGHWVASHQALLDAALDLLHGSAKIKTAESGVDSGGSGSGNAQGGSGHPAIPLRLVSKHIN